jgi:hypothetical protein
VELRTLDDVDAVRVHADALLDANDPRGELIALACEVERRPELGPRYAELLANETARLKAGPLAGLDPPFGPPQLAWRHGFADVVRVTCFGDQALDLAAFVDDPALRLARVIEIEASEIDGTGDLAGPFAALSARAHGLPRLREFAVSHAPNLGSPYKDGPIAISDCTALLTAFPRLERLELVGHPLVLAPFALPAVRRLVLAGMSYAQALLIAEAELPALEELDVGFRFTAGSTVDEVDALLDAAHAPRVLRVEIASSWMPDLLQRLPAAHLTRAVRTLKLPRLDDACIPMLAGLRAFPRVEIRGHRLGPAVRAELARLGNVHFV